MDTPTRSVFDIVTDFLANRPSDEEMLAYEIPPEQQARFDELIEIDTNSRLTAVQRDELGDYRFVEDVMARVKVKIKLRLERERSDHDSGADADTEEDKS